MCHFEICTYSNFSKFSKLVNFCLESTCIYSQYVQDDVVVDSCCCDSHHAHVQVVIINLSTITCFGDVRFLNLICTIPSSVVPANTHELLACTLMHHPSPHDSNIDLANGVAQIPPIDSELHEINTKFKILYSFAGWMYLSFITLMHAVMLYMCIQATSTQWCFGSIPTR